MSTPTGRRRTKIVRRRQKNLYDLDSEDQQGNAETNSNQQRNHNSLQEDSSQQEVSPYLFEYLDHTADILIHAWGPDLPAAFLAAGYAMGNYMTPLAAVQKDPNHQWHVSAEGPDLQKLLFRFLDQLLESFHVEQLIWCSLELVSFSREPLRIEATCRGEKFREGHHEQGTEVKAITYSAMEIKETGDRADVFVVLDI